MFVLLLGVPALPLPTGGVTHYGRDPSKTYGR